MATRDSLAGADASRFFLNEGSDECEVDDGFSVTLSEWAAEVARIVDAHQSKSNSIYTGAGGVALMYCRMALTADKRSKLLDEAQRTRQGITLNASHCYKRALELIANTEKSFTRLITFLEGAAGSLALQCLVNHKLQEFNASEEKLEILRSIGRRVNALPDEDCELLYGRAGYLYAIAFCRHELGNPTICAEEARLVIAGILRQGMAASPQQRKVIPLNYEWHRSTYLGAAHGYAGILMSLLLFADNDLPIGERLAGMQSGEAMAAIENCVLQIIRIFSFPSGNIKSSVGSDRDRLVHWCHGAPGWIPLIAKCVEIFPANRDYYNRVLITLGDVVWSRGLLRKGLGLCHGIGGNGLALLTIYRTTGDERWLRRARRFASFGINKFDELLSVPDRPYSLFEGAAGFAVFLNELLHPESSRFPGFEL